MPIAFAPFVGLAMGAAFAWLAAPELAREVGSLAMSRSFAIVAAFAGFVWFPAVGYFVAFHGDWSYLYVVPWRRVPSAVDFGLVLLATATVPGAFFLAAEPVRRRRSGLLVTMIVAPGAIAVAGATTAAGRLAVSGTYAQFHGGFGTEAIGASALGKGVLLMGVACALGVAWTVRWLAVMGTDGTHGPGQRPGQHPATGPAQDPVGPVGPVGPVLRPARGTGSPSRDVHDSRRGSGDWPNS